MNSPDIKQYIINRSNLFWYIPEDNKEDISPELLIETIFNYGTLDDARKFTFFQYPFEIKAKSQFNNIVRVPELLDLAAMKAYALGRRSKWKDYVDMYFLLKDHFAISQISVKATEIFGELYSEKLFRAQLCFFNDIDYSETVEFMNDEIANMEIMNFLTEISTNLGTRN